MAIKFDVQDAFLTADASLPWLPIEPYSGLVAVKLIAVNPAGGEVVLLVRAPPGIELPAHRSTGPLTIYTQQGRWQYREHDWVAGPGSVVVEPVGTRHTPQIVADGTDDAVLFVVASGELQLLDIDDRVIAVENWRTATEHYMNYCMANELVPRDLTRALTAGNAPWEIDRD
jgi:quercetin dioxygenase-like cupin family protein